VAGGGRFPLATHQGGELRTNRARCPVFSRILSLDSEQISDRIVEV